MSTPDDATLLEALQSFRVQNPAMARAKVLQELKAKNGWVLSEKRLKTCMDTHHLNTEEIESRKMKEAEAKSKIVEDHKSALPKLPQNPLQAQIKYKEESQRYIILYGSGEYNYGITPNSDMGIFIGLCVDRIVKFLEANTTRPLPQAQKLSLARYPPVRNLWSFYKAGAKIAGISLEYVARQFQAEYETDPRLGEEKDPARAEAVERRKAEEYKIGKIKILREIAKTNAEYVTLDSRGNPVYDEAKHGQYALIVMKIDRNGNECGRV